MREISKSPAFDEQAKALGMSLGQIDALITAVHYQERAGLLPAPHMELNIAVRPERRAPNAPRRVWIRFTADGSSIRLLEISARPL